MLTDYVSAALRRARYEILSDDHSYYGEVPGFDGVYANALTLEECREELKVTLEDWILLRVSRQLPLPLLTAAAIGDTSTHIVRRSGQGRKELGWSAPRGQRPSRSTSRSG